MFEKKKADVISHWYALVPGLTTSTKEFYEYVETDLKGRQVPGLDIFYVDFAEGGVLSQKREYLRMTRERLVFDICAAPFGTAYFFSCRFAEIPAAIKLWQLLVVLLASLTIMGLTIKFAGVLLGIFILLAGLVAMIYTLRNAVAIGLQDLDTTLIKSPVFGPIYECWFRKETYYRHDIRPHHRNRGRASGQRLGASVGGTTTASFRGSKGLPEAPHSFPACGADADAG